MDRLQLQEVLEGLLGTSQVYFQPPNNVQMEYPCIVYKRDTANTAFAGNLPYRHTKRYQVTVIDQNPDSLIPDKVAQLPMCIHNRHFSVGHLNHDIYILYF